MRLALTLLAMALLAPPAAGQLALVDPQLSVFASDPGRAFIPGTAEAIDVVVTFGPTNTGRPTPAPTADRPEDSAPTHITLSVKAKPDWIDNVAFDPPELLIQMRLENGTGSTYSRTAQAILNVSPTAPALIREDIVIVATAAPNGNMQGKTAESPPLKLRATTIGKLNLTAEPTMIIPGGRWTEVPFTIRNDGNSDILAKVNVTVRPENSQVEFAPRLELKRGESATVNVRVRTPWTNAEFGTLGLEAIPIVDGEDGKSAQAEIEVRGESAVPTGGAGVTLALLASLALLARRR